MDKLDGKVIFITGGSKGIGLGCATKCLQAGARLAIADLDPDGAVTALRDAGVALGKDALVLACDVRNESAFAEAVETAAERFGRLDGFVNNAGWHPPPMTIEQTSLADFEALVRLNLTSRFLGCKYAIPHLRRTRGAIVNIASEVALIGQEAAVSYVATKAGQIGLTRALALDLAPAGIRVNAICPAGVMTPLMEEWANGQPDRETALRSMHSIHALGRMAAPEEIGAVCAFLLSSEASFITGQAICPDGGAALGYRNFDRSSND